MAFKPPLCLTAAKGAAAIACVFAPRKSNCGCLAFFVRCRTITQIKRRGKPVVREGTIDAGVGRAVLLARGARMR